MTGLRKRMLEELQRRNYSSTTIGCYLRVVEAFTRYFGKRPDHLTGEHIREYHLYLLRERKLTPRTVGLRISALRFFFVNTLRRPNTNFIALNALPIEITPTATSTSP